MEHGACIRRAHTQATDAREAVRDLHAALAQDDMALVVFFCASTYDLEALAAEMAARFAGTPVVGCTAAGEIGPAGYLTQSLSGVSFGARHFTAAVGRVDALQHFDALAGQQLVRDVQSRLDERAPPGTRRFGLMLIDGLSVREETVARALQSALGATPLFGGSAADATRSGRTLVYADGRFSRDTATLALLATPLPFRVFDTHHFGATDTRMVVTAADPVRRIVHEINGRPAADEYARLLGVDVAALTPAHFAASPVVVIIGGRSYVRSIQRANPDGSLTFFCAIENGLILRLAHGEDLCANLQDSLARIHAEIGPPELVLACDCLLRHLEVQRSPQRAAIERALADNRTTGFATFGEQFRGAHLNQTFAAVAIGAPAGDSDDA